MKFIHLLMMVLASWRMVDLFGQDRITAWVREKWPTYLWMCPRCLSVWMGIVATLIFVVMPWANWPLAISWLYMWRIENMVARPKNNRRIIIELDGADTIRMTHSDLNGAQAFGVLQTLLKAATPPQENPT